MGKTWCKPKLCENSDHVCYSPLYAQHDHSVCVRWAHESVAIQLLHDECGLVQKNPTHQKVALLYQTKNRNLVCSFLRNNWHMKKSELDTERNPWGHLMQKFKMCGQRIVRRVDGLLPEWENVCRGHTFSVTWINKVLNINALVQVYEDVAINKIKENISVNILSRDICLWRAESLVSVCIQRSLHKEMSEKPG